LRVGVLAVQGAFVEHIRVLKRLGVDVFEIRQLKDLDQRIDGLVLPGGESTTQSRLLRDLGLFLPLKKRIQEGLPVLATCAGTILLSEKIDDDPTTHFQTLPVTVKRNYYGRQTGSFQKKISFENQILDLIFIRAPLITATHPDVNVLIRLDEGVVAVEYRHQIALNFHPELSHQTYFHERFLKLIQARLSQDNSHHLNAH
jgi:5'-phosphate synthase pdxT subunit